MAEAIPIPPKAPPLVLVVSGPSGVGKTVLCERLIAGDPFLVDSISATTRPPRSGEEDGVHYYFWSEDRFREGVREGLFLEWAEVHGHLYGTLAATVDASLRRGRSPVLNVDVQGGRSVKGLRPDAVLVFLVPPAMEALEQRLRGRATDDEETIRRRLRNAREEIREWEHYDYVVLNDELPRAIETLRAVLQAERSSVTRVKRFS